MDDFMSFDYQFADRTEAGDTVLAMRQLSFIFHLYFETSESFVDSIETKIFKDIHAWINDGTLREDGRWDEMQRDAYKLRKYLFDEKRLDEIMENNVKWPSRWITAEVRSAYNPMIYGKYQDAMKAKEKKVKELIVKIVETQIRVIVVKFYLTVPVDQLAAQAASSLASSSSSSAAPAPAPARDPDAPIRDEEKIKESMSFWIKTMGTLQSQAGTYKPSETLIHPKKHDLETEMLLTLNDHLVMTAPEADIISESTTDPSGKTKEKRQQTKAKKKKDEEDQEQQLTPAEYYRDLYRVWGLLRNQLSNLVIFEYPKMINEITKVSMEEAQVVAGFERELAKVWQTILKVWNETLGPDNMAVDPPLPPGLVAKSKKQVQADFEPILITRFAETNQIFERYLKTVPVLTFEGAPKQKTYDLLYATEYGTFVYRMYDAASPTLPKVAALKWPFLKNVPDFVSMLSVVPWKKDMLDRIQNFFLGYSTDDAYRTQIKQKYKHLT